MDGLQRNSQGQAAAITRGEELRQVLMPLEMPHVRADIRTAAVISSGPCFVGNVIVIHLVVVGNSPIGIQSDWRKIILRCRNWKS